VERLHQRWDDWKSGIGSNGPPLPGVEAKFVIDDTRIAAIGEEGELWIRGPTVFNGYRGEPDMTAGCMTPDGWFKTGEHFSLLFPLLDLGLSSTLSQFLNTP
jgi:long-subunit acyl-CoA synthetase (AMP-forming)